MSEVEAARQKRLNALLERAAWLEAADPGDQDDEGMAVMDALLAVYDLLAKWRSADPAEAEVIRARVRLPRLAEVLRGERAQSALSAYASEGERYALRGRNDGYREACEFRSAIKLLTDDYEGVVVDPFAQEELDGFEDELREAAEDATPVHRYQIPAWADRSHWWWWKPDHIDMSMREYRNRIFAGDIEEYESKAPGAADWLRCGDEECWCFTAPA
ncbi:MULTISPECIES: hypothetical protein [Actinomadura]|uniref:Uncharacterized protein n=1 Tax=Actinomadura litoris TaxID=2678616 RepID=A0A7K1L7X7_9ACTN|nr:MULTISPECIES: hypothetical protein [Actinomadura]MBT2210594.1 hypothetical protein [Actinomadura sp. NEAU-AAG7]MUN40413.1 hypothetical protein [Actinomadura litoris]